MSKRPVDEHSGTETTGHEWDGITELDTPLPRWWLGIFYACIAFAIGYWVLFPAWPGLHGYTHGILHNSARAQVAVDLKQLAVQRGAGAAKLKTATLEQIEADPAMQAYAVLQGQSIFGDNCATCHGQSGTGGKGYPNLRDDVWLWGGTLEDIARTIRYGVRADDPQTRFSKMPAFGKDTILPAAQIEAFLQTGEWRGVAGGYRIQGRAAGFALELQGSYSGVVGLPLYETLALLEGLGYRGG